MSSIFARIKKRAALAVGDTGLFVRELTFGEVNQVQRLKDEARTWLTLAFCLVDEHGERLFQPLPDESIEDIAARMKSLGEEHLTAGILNQINACMERLARPANMEQLAKN